MHLHKLELHDFGAYRGKQSLDLSVEPGRPIVLIGGLNGCGKTTLLDAIQLVLYGPRARCSGRGNRSYDSYLRESINRKANKSDGAEIALEFSIVVDDQERHYRVIRSWHTSGKQLKEFLNVLVDGQFDRILSDGWPDHVEDILPLEVASLFFFDGEKIESLADPERAASVIESAVHSLLGVSTVEQLRTDLLALARRQRLSNEDQAIIDHIRAQEAEHEAARQEAADRHQELGSIRSRCDRLQAKLEKKEKEFERAGGKLFERLKELEANREAIAERLAAQRTALRSLASGPLPLLMLPQQLATLREQAVREKDADDATRVVGVLEERDAWLLDQLPASVTAAVRTALKKKLATDRQKRESAAELKQSLSLPLDALQQFSALDEALARDASRARELLKESAETADRLDDADRLLAGVPDEKLIKDLVEERNEAMDALAVAKDELRRCEVQWEEAKSRHLRIGADLERAQKKRVKTLIEIEELNRIVEYAERARGTLEKFGEALLRRHISRLEVAVLQSFKALMRKSGLIHDLRIDTANSTLTLADSDGEPIDPGRLSAGERQLLAISLLWGLAKVAGNRLPSVIDTPLGRLDSRHRQHLVDRYFPKAGRQVLLLSTDEEIDESLLARLKPSLAHTYTLVHDDTQFTTTVEAGYWWTAGAPHVA
ncbi:DNA sulfur modification protein DndD [Streptomyces sp. D2-8]|uniref:DNA sulfur modification protein DndD n=1 Tax=Streptomyces sp. D2-8 TaxID=2707767 RepID=UPI0020BF12D6|nr:DNA sulfur modification protein DndD [Streptomyces sp. D2-8]MCK8431897.1 DNA sulfur modification protein DndD [Streptomyces sp. D2-8]